MMSFFTYRINSQSVALINFNLKTANALIMLFLRKVSMKYKLVAQPVEKPHAKGPNVDLANLLAVALGSKVKELSGPVQAEVESKLSLVFVQNALDPMIMMDDKGNVSFWNPAAEKAFGFTSAEVLGQNLHQLITPDQYRPQYEPALTHFYKTGDGPLIGRSRKLVAKRKDGSEFPIELSLQKASVDGHWHAIGVVRDITKEDQINKELKANEIRLRFVLEGARLGSWDWYPQTNRVDYNDQWAEMLGFEPEEIKHTLEEWSSLVHPEDMPSVMHELNSHLEGKTDIYEAEHRCRRKTGEWIWTLGRGKVMERDVHGSPIRVSGMHLDINDHKVAEELLVQAKAELEHRVEERTSELKLAQEKALEQQKWETIANMVAGITHHFKNILLGLDAQSTLLGEQLTQLSFLLSHELPYLLWTEADTGPLLSRMTGLTADAQQSLNIIKTNQRRMQKNTFSLLAKSAQERGPVHPVNVQEQLQQTISLFEINTKEKQILFTYDLASNLGYLMAASTDLENILSNLLTNAIDALESSEIKTLRVSASRQGGEVSIEVSDSGEGIPADVLSKIFDPYFTTKTHRNGTGIGLSEVALLVTETLGGSVQVESTLGVGSCFSVRLPVVENQLKHEQSGKDPLTSRVERLAGLVAGEDQLSILLVEDEDHLAEPLIAVLKSNGFTNIQWALNGEEALNLTSNSRFDVIISDQNMPSMTGSKFITLLTERGVTQPLIFLGSGISFDNSEGAMIKAVLAAYYEKRQKAIPLGIPAFFSKGEASNYLLLLNLAHLEKQDPALLARLSTGIDSLKMVTPKLERTVEETIVLNLNGMIAHDLRNEVSFGMWFSMILSMPQKAEKYKAKVSISLNKAKLTLAEMKGFIAQYHLDLEQVPPLELLHEKRRNSPGDIGAALVALQQLPPDIFESTKRNWFYLCLDLEKVIGNIEALFSEYQQLEQSENPDASRIAEIFAQIKSGQAEIINIINLWIQ